MKMNCDFDRLWQLEDRAFDAVVVRALRHDDGSAAQEHLLAGRPIYYCDDAFDEHDLVREWPTGARELVEIGHNGEVTVRACVIPLG